MRAFHTEASDRGKHIAGHALGAQILVAALEAAEGTQNAIAQILIVVISRVGASVAGEREKETQGYDGRSEQGPHGQVVYYMKFYQDV